MSTRACDAWKCEDGKLLGAVEARRRSQDKVGEDLKHDGRAKDERRVGKIVNKIKRLRMTKLSQAVSACFYCLSFPSNGKDMGECGVGQPSRHTQAMTAFLSTEAWLEQAKNPRRSLAEASPTLRKHRPETFTTRT